MAGLKFGNTSFNIERLAFKNKSEFIEIYKGKMTTKQLDEAWDGLKKYVKEEPKEETFKKVEHKHKKTERE